MVIFASLLLKLASDPAIEWFQAIDWKKVEQAISNYCSRKRRGNPGYPLIKKLKLVLLGYFRGIRSPTGIARLSRKAIFRELSGLSKEISHDCINDFINSSSELIEKIFCLVRNEAIELGIIKGRQQAIDPTKIESPFVNSSDGKWSYDDVRSKKEGKDCYYFGYGALFIIDAESHLPLAVVETKSKKINLKDFEFCLLKTPIKPKVLLGDPEFDMVRIQNKLLKLGVLPLIPINPRRRKRKPRKKYRVQELLGLKAKLNAIFNAMYRARAEADHAIATLKERFGLEDVHLKSIRGIRSHLLLCCIHRIADAIVIQRRHPEQSVRRSFLCI